MAGLTVAHLVAGLIGGLIRGLVGITKSSTFTPEKFKFQWQYFSFSLLVAAIVGVLAGVIAGGDWRLSLLAGYAGVDFLESLYRLKFANIFKVGS